MIGSRIRVIVKPAQIHPAIVRMIGVGLAAILVVAAAESNIGDRLPAPGPASVFGRDFRYRLPFGGVGPPGSDDSAAASRQNLRFPVKHPIIEIAAADLQTPGPALSRAQAAVSTAGIAPIRASQGAGRMIALIRMRIRAIALGRDGEPLDPLSAPPFLPGKLKNAVDADPGNARFPLGQPTLLGRDKTAENAALSVIDGIIPLVAVFAGGPGFRLAESVRLVDAAIEGLAPVFGQGFQDGGVPVGVGKGLPVGTVPGYRPALGSGCPPPLLRSLKGIGQGRLRFCGGTWQFPPGWG